MFKILSSNSGSSIITVLTGLSILSVSIYTLTDTINSSQKMTRVIKQNLYADMIAQQFKHALSSNDVCRHNFQNIDVSNVDADNFINMGAFDNHLKTPFSADAIYEKDQPVGSGALDYRGMRLLNMAPDHAMVFIDFEKRGGYIGAKQLLRTIRIRYMLAGTLISDCVAEDVTLVADGCAMVGGTLNGVICEDPYLPVNPITLAVNSFNSAGDVFSPVQQATANATFTADINALGGASIVADSTLAATVNSTNIIADRTEGRASNVGAIVSRFHHEGTVSVTGQICDGAGGSCQNDWTAKTCPVGANGQTFIRSINADGSLNCGDTFW